MNNVSLLEPSLPHIASSYIYDVALDKFRPIFSSDFAGGSAGSDAFGRQRVSNPEMIFNSKLIFDNAPLYWNDVAESGSGTNSSHSTNTAAVTLSVSTNTAGKRTRQTYMRFNYQPSKSQLIFMTGILIKSGGGTGIKSRLGLFDDDNGLYLEYDAGNVYLVRRTYAGGSASDNRVIQSSWNIDKMDGTGPSGITIDFTKTQIFFMDFEWLGVGRVRYGFNINGISYYVHELYNANNLTSVYMSTPNLPLRYQIINDGTGAASTMDCICSAVISEGGKEDIGTNLYVSTGTSVITAAKDQNNALLGIRLKSAYKGCTIDIIDTGIFCSSIDSYEWKLILNPTVNGTFTYNDMTNSPLQSALGNGSTNYVTGGTVLAGGYGTSKTAADTNALKNLIKLGSSVAGTMDTLVLCVYPLGSNAITVYASINYRAFA